MIFGLLPLILISVWVYIWRRLVLTARFSPKNQKLVTGFLFVLLLLEVATPLLMRHSREMRHPYRFLVTSYVILGFVDLLFFFTLAKDVVQILLRFLPPVYENPNRRLFLARGLNLAALGLAGGATLIGGETAKESPKVKRVSIKSPGLNKNLKGLKIAQISDLHVGGGLQKGEVERIVDTVNSTQPDLIAFTGDFADGPARDLLSATEPLKNLSAPYGKFYVTGNHEYYWNVDEWTKRAQDLGFDYLFNTHKLIDVKGAKLIVGGVADYNCSRIRPDHCSDPKESLRNSPPSDFKLLLAHQPKSCYNAYEAGYDLQLSGHTHNGQFFPNNLVIGLFHPYVRGLNLHKNKMWVYVSSGTGYWGPPLRLGIPSEIALLTLES